MCSSDLGGFRFLLPWISGNNGGAIDVGFKPRFLIVKDIDTNSTNWMMYDSFREPNDTKNTVLYSNSDSSEDSHNNNEVVFDTTGFKFTANSAYPNTSGKTFIYAAFA